jgi:ADP-heptose:LPS heptosyltransferase
LWYVARPVVAAARPWARRPRAAADRILAVEYILRVGDTLVTRPALAALRAQFPEAKIAVVCQPALAPLLRADPLVDVVIPAAPGGRGFARAAQAARAFGASRAYCFVPDRWAPYLAWLAGARERVGYDYAARGGLLTTRVRPPARANVPGLLYAADAPPIHAAAIWLGLVDSAAPTPTAYPPFDAGERARGEVAAWLWEAGWDERRPLVILHSGAANPSYLWFPAAWDTVARDLAARYDAYFAITGDGREEAAAAALAAALGPGRAGVAAGRLTLLGALALAARARLVVSLDTAMVHIAATAGTPVVGLYGPGDAAMWAPLGVPYRAVVGETPCRECKAARCFQDRRYCMEAITPAMVTAAADALLERGDG